MHFSPSSSSSSSSSSSASLSPSPSLLSISISLHSHIMNISFSLFVLVVGVVIAMLSRHCPAMAAEASPATSRQHRRLHQHHSQQQHRVHDLLLQLARIVSTSTLEKPKATTVPKIPALPGPGQCDPEGPTRPSAKLGGKLGGFLGAFLPGQDIHPGMCARRVEDFLAQVGLWLCAFFPSVAFRYHSGDCS